MLSRISIEPAFVVEVERGGTAAEQGAFRGVGSRDPIFSSFTFAEAWTGCLGKLWRVSIHGAKWRGVPDTESPITRGTDRAE
jgi:hypothetical protein